MTIKPTKTFMAIVGTFCTQSPGCVLKGYTMHRRVYGPYRLKGPLMRRGWKSLDGCRRARNSRLTS